MPSRPAAARVAFLLSSIVVAAASSEAAAQKPVPVPPVEVVATRLPEATHDVPVSIEVISGDVLRARGVTSLVDALSLAAGISVAPGGDGGPASAVPEIWGLREFDAFLLVVDGIPWGGAFNPAISTLSLRDVERIEILRGPAPVTFGATSFVGVIHVVHSAAAATARYAEVHGGTYASGGASLDYAMPLSGNWKSRLSVDLDKQGFKDDNTGIRRGHGLWRVASVEDTKKTWLSVDANILMQDPASPHPRQGAALSTAVPLDANYNPKEAYINENRLAISAGMDRPVMNGAVWGSTASYTFSSNSQFRGFLTNIANTANNAAGYKEDIEIQDIYADTHIIWPMVSQMRFMAGADLLFANGEAKGATFNYTVPLSGTTQTAVTEPTTLDKDAEARRIFSGAYGSVEWKPATQFTLSAGLRLNATNERRGEGESTTNSKMSGSIGALLSLWEQGADHVRAFVNFRDTFKPAAFDFSLAENEGVLDPETSRSYEGGLKLRAMDGRIDVEASAFRMDFKNLVTSTVVNNLPALINAGTTRFQGFEVASDLRLDHSVYLRGSVALHDGKFVDFIQAFDGTPTQLAGKRFEMSAKKLASAGITLAPEKGFIGSASVNYTGDRYLNKRNTALVPGYSTIDIGVGYRTDRAEFRVDGRNLGDRRDAVSESEFGDAQYYRMTARSIRAGVVVKY